MAKEIILVCPECKQEIMMESTKMITKKIIKCRSCKYFAEHYNWIKKDPKTGKIWNDKSE
ncbi:MAG: hypothetical protein HQ534_00440 [Armatimonadetes bacterium]|nr:hypothetical protein [Armatimonadota bacterium]